MRIQFCCVKGLLETQPLCSNRRVVLSWFAPTPGLNLDWGIRLSGLQTSGSGEHLPPMGPPAPALAVGSCPAHALMSHWTPSQTRQTQQGQQSRHVRVSSAV